MYRVKTTIPYANYDSELFTTLSRYGFSIYWQNTHTLNIDYAIRHDDMSQYQAICIYNGDSYPGKAIEYLTAKGVSYSMEP